MPTGGVIYEWLHNEQIALDGTSDTYTNSGTVLLGEYQLIIREDGNEECFNESPVTNVPGRVAFQVLDFSTIGSPTCETTIEPQFNIELDATHGNSPYSVIIANTV